MISRESCRFRVDPLIHHALVFSLFVITVNLTGRPASQFSVFSSLFHKVKWWTWPESNRRPLSSPAITSFTSLFDIDRISKSYLGCILVSVTLRKSLMVLDVDVSLSYQASDKTRDSLKLPLTLLHEKQRGRWYRCHLGLLCLFREPGISLTCSE